MDEKDVKYWERRKAQRMWEHMQSAEETAEQISKVYWKSSGYINHQIDTIYNRFKSKHHLSDNEAKALLNRMSDKSSISELLSELRQETDSDEKKELLKLLESPAYSSRIQRLQEVQNEIDEMMKSVYSLEQERSTRHYTNLVNEAYYKSVYDIQKDTGLAFSFAKISQKQIDKVLHSKWSGKNYSARIWNNTRALAKSLKEELLINLMTGRTDREVAEIIQNKFQSGAMEARRLVRTESCFIANEMEGQSYEECGIGKYMFVATLDKKTSETCKALDRKVFNVKNRTPGKNCPPMHPWCRSTTIAYLNDKTLSSLTRRARDPETGETYKVPANMSYPEWYETYVKSDPRKENAVKAYKNRHNDKRQYERYRSVYRGDKNFKSFENFQDMKYNKGDDWQQYKRTLKTTEMKNFISDSGYAYVQTMTDNEILVTRSNKPTIIGMRQHAIDNIAKKSDRKTMTQENAQRLVNDAKLIVFRKSNRTFKYIADDGYCSLNENYEVVTAVPQKWRKKYDKYLKKEE